MKKPPIPSKILKFKIKPEMKTKLRLLLDVYKQGLNLGKKKVKP